MGAVVGATLGAPMRGQVDFRKLNYYEPIPMRMAPNHSLDAWLVWARHLAKGLPPETLSGSLHAGWTYTSNEAAFGQANLARGFSAPMSGCFQNPLCDGAEGLGRAVLWGLVHPDNPERAARFAFFDASIDHAGDAVDCAVAVATMAAVGGDPHRLLKAATDALPPGGGAKRALTRLMQAFNAGNDVMTAYEVLPPSLPTQDPHYATLNLAYILMGVLYGKGDFGASIKIAAGCGGSSDQTTLVVGALLARETDIDEEWTSPLAEQFVAGHGLRGIDPPETLDAFAETIASAGVFPPGLPSTPVQEVVPGALEADVTEPDQSELEIDLAVPTVSTAGLATRLQRWQEQTERASVTAIGDLVVEIRNVDLPVIVPGKTNRFVLTARNEGSEERIIDPILSGPVGWQIASKLTSFRLRPGEESQFPFVAQAPAEAEHGSVTNLRLEILKQEVLIPLLAHQGWYWVGPFVNNDGMAFDHVYRPEDVQVASEVFNGRSGLPVRWTREPFPGVVFDLEPKFSSGPGVLYLFAKADFGQEGKLRLVVATSVGARAWVDRREIVKYHDTHTPTPRAIQPYVGEFVTSGRSEILIKIMRNLAPIPSVVIYFLAEDGRHIEPLSFGRMEG